jgi:LacI family transcriptional regulator
MKKITISEIAKEARVSKSTVSLALRGSDRVTKKTKEKIFRVVKKYNYYPNSIAQQLASGKTGIIAIVTTRFAGTFVTPLLSSIENYIYQEKKFADIKIQMYSTFNIKKSKQDILNKILFSHLADAVIVVTIRPEKTIVDSYEKNGVPLILIENEFKNAHSVTIDNEIGVKKVMDYFLSENKRDVIFVVGSQEPPKDEDFNISARERLIAFKNWHNENKIKLKEENIYYSQAYSFLEGKEIAEKILKRKKLPDAIFCAAGDIMAAGIIQKLAENKIKIPNEIAIVGYDNQLISQTTTPALTTVDQKLDEVGKIAFMIATEALKSRQNGFKNIKIIPDLIIRGTA